MVCDVGSNRARAKIQGLKEVRALEGGGCLCKADVCCPKIEVSRLISIPMADWSALRLILEQLTMRLSVG